MIATREQLVNEIQSAMTNAGIGDGLCYELYYDRLQNYFKWILKEISPDFLEEAKQIMREHDWEEGYVKPDYGPGVCQLTGIDEDCCPCGRHE